MKTKRILFSFTLLLFSFTMLRAQDELLLRYLPPHAFSVTAANLHRLRDKIGRETLENSVLFKKMMESPDTTVISFFLHSREKGLDLSAPLFFVTTYDTSGGETKSLTHIYGKLSDKDAFAATVNELDKKKEIKTYGTNHVLIETPRSAYKQPVSLAWNNEVFVLTFSEFGPFGKWKRSFPRNWEAAENNFDAEEAVKERRNLCFELLTPRYNNSYLTNTRFTDAWQTQPDMFTWRNGVSNPLLERLLGEFKFPLKLSLFEQQSVMTGHFENGRYVSQTRSWPGKDMQELYEKYPSAEQNDALLRRLPKGKLIALLSTSFNQQMGKEMFVRMGLPQLLDSLKKHIPFDLSAVTGAFGQDMLIALVQPDDADAFADQQTGTEGNMLFYAAMPIRDMNAFTLLKKNFRALKDSLMKNEKTGRTLKNMKFAFQHTDSLFVLTGSAAAASHFLENKGGMELPAWIAQERKYPVFFRMEMKGLTDIIQEKLAGEESGPGQVYAQFLLGLFESFSSFGGNYENGMISSRMEIKMTNKDENALSQLVNMINTLVEDQEKRDRERRAQYQKDEEGIEGEKIAVDTAVTIDMQMQEGVKEEVMPPPPPPPPPPPMVDEEDILFTKVEIEARYKGDWNAFLEKNRDIGHVIERNPPAGTYTVIVRFVVNKEGAISDVVAETKFGYGMEAEAIRLIKKTNKWIPAIQNGHKVKAWHRQPITFVIPEKK